MTVSPSPTSPPHHQFPSVPPPTPLRQLQHGTPGPRRERSLAVPTTASSGVHGRVLKALSAEAPLWPGHPPSPAHAGIPTNQSPCAFHADPETVLCSGYRCLVSHGPLCLTPYPTPVNKSLVRVSLSRARMTSPSFPNHCPPEHPPGPPSREWTTLRSSFSQVKSLCLLADQLGCLSGTLPCYTI